MRINKGQLVNIIPLPLSIKILLKRRKYKKVGQIDQKIRKLDLKILKWGKRTNGKVASTTTELEPFYFWTYKRLFKFFFFKL